MDCHYMKSYREIYFAVAYFVGIRDSLTIFYSRVENYIRALKKSCEINLIKRTCPSQNGLFHSPVSLIHDSTYELYFYYFLFIRAENLISSLVHC